MTIDSRALQTVQLRTHTVGRGVVRVCREYRAEFFHMFVDQRLYPRDVRLHQRDEVISVLILPSQR